jgi:hypothetical protein
MENTEDLSCYEIREAFEQVRLHLPDDENLRAIFSILSDDGSEICKSFYQQHEKPTNVLIAQFLGIAVSTVQRHKRTIKILCFYMGLTP